MATRRRSKAGPDKCRKAKTTSRALSLRIKGMSYEQIASTVGCSVSKAYNDVKSALEKIEAECAEKAEEVRRIELTRIDSWLKALQPGIDAGEPRPIETALRLSERRSKLLGLDAPSKQEVSGPDGGAIPIEDARNLLAARLAAVAEKPEPSATEADSDDSAG
jgi:hypothetical protein